MLWSTSFSFVLLIGLSECGFYVFNFCLKFQILKTQLKRYYWSLSYGGVRKRRTKTHSSWPFKRAFLGRNSSFCWRIGSKPRTTTSSTRRTTIRKSKSSSFSSLVTLFPLFSRPLPVMAPIVSDGVPSAAFHLRCIRLLVY